jgi:hypothetical protein
MALAICSFLVLVENGHCVSAGDRSGTKWCLPPFLLLTIRLCAQAWRQRKERVGHVELDSDGPGPSVPRVYRLALVLAYRDDPGPGALRVSSLALAAAAMGRFQVVLAAANSRVTALSATHGRAAHSF